MRKNNNKLGYRSFRPQSSIMVRKVTTELTDSMVTLMVSFAPFLVKRYQFDSLATVSYSPYLGVLAVVNVSEIL